MTDLYHVQLDFGYGTKWEEFDYETFKSFWPLAAEEKPTNVYAVPCGPCRISNEEVAGISLLGIKVQLIPYPGAMLSKMEDRKKWEYNAQVHPFDVIQGQAVQIAIPDIGLMLIDEVEVHEDCCTHELQGLLDDGWRILAVCPPNAQRRPDYVLGRRKSRGN